MKLTKNKVEQLLLGLLILTLTFNKKHLFGFVPVLGQQNDFFSIYIYVSDLILAVITVFLGFLAYKKQLLRLNKWFGLYFGLLLLSFLYIPRGSLWDTYTLLRIISFIITFYFGYLVSRGKENFIALSMTSLGLVQSFFAILQYFLQRSLNLSLLGESQIARGIVGVAKVDIGGEKVVRAYGTFAHPNQLAAFLLVAYGTTIYLFMKARTKTHKGLAALTLLVLIFGISVTFSRAGIGALLLETAIILIVSKVRLKFPIKQAGAVVLLGLVISIGLLNPILKARSTISDHSVSERLNYNRVGLNIIKANPIIGVGVGNLMFAMEQSLNAKESWQVQSPHNYFLDVASETGALGLLLFLILFGLILRGLWTDQLGDRLFNIVVLAVLGAFIFLMMFDHYFYTLQQTQILLWLIMGIAASRLPIKSQGL